MNQKRPRRHRRAQKESGVRSELNRPFVDTMKEHLDTRMDEARARYEKSRDEGRFFFLKGGEVWPPPRVTETASAQSSEIQVSNSPAESHHPDISAIDRIFEGAEWLETSAQIERIMNDLTPLAQAGDPRIAQKLHWIAVKAIVALNWLVMKKPEVLRPIARKEFCSPALIGRKRSIKQTNDRIIKILQLGQEEVLFSGRGWQMSAPSTQAAFDLFLTALSYQDDWKLPPLTNKTKRTWFEVAWQQMLNDGIKPEKIPWLAPVGKSAIGKRSISRGMSDQTDGMKRDDVRAEIKRQVRNAFDKLVADAAKQSK